MKKLALVTLLLLLSLSLIVAIVDEPVLDKFVFLPLVSKDGPTPTPTPTPRPTPTAVRPTPTAPNQ